MLFSRTKSLCDAGAKLLRDRVLRFQRGERTDLIREAAPHRAPRKQSARPAFDAEAKLFQAVSHVRSGDLSRAASTLTASPIAPGNADTLSKLTDPDRRPVDSARPLTAEDLNSEPHARLHLGKSQFLETMRSAKRGVAPGRCGTRQEHLRALLEIERVTDNLYYFAAQLAQSNISEELRAGLAVSSLTALRKTDEAGRLTDDIRGIATGIAIRRLTLRTIAQQYANKVLDYTSPSQFALSTRAGVDCVALLCRLLTDEDENRVISSLDGIGAYDHVAPSSPSSAPTRS